MWDRDIISSNDFLSHFELDLGKLIEDCKAIQKPLHLNKKYFERHFKDSRSSLLDESLSIC